MPLRAKKTEPSGTNPLLDDGEPKKRKDSMVIAEGHVPYDEYASRFKLLKRSV